MQALERVVRADSKLREQYDRTLQILMNDNDGTSTSQLVDNARRSSEEPRPTTVCIDEHVLAKTVRRVLGGLTSYCLYDDDERETVEKALILEIKKASESDR